MVNNKKPERGSLSAGWKAAIDCLMAEVDKLDQVVDTAQTGRLKTAADVKAASLHRAAGFLSARAEKNGIDIR